MGAGWDMHAGRTDQMTADDVQGIEGVLLENRARLIRFLEAHGAADASEDLFQELWMRVSARPTGPVANPLAYLYRAANNLMIDRHRAERQQSLREKAWSEQDGAGTAERSDAPAADRAMIAREELDAANIAIEALGERAATAFRRFRLDGASQRDIAAELGVSLSTVEADLRKAYHALIALRRRFDER